MTMVARTRAKNAGTAFQEMLRNGSPLTADNNLAAATRARGYRSKAANLHSFFPNTGYSFLSPILRYKTGYSLLLPT